MKESLILEIVQAWKKLSKAEKIKILQDFESLNAKLQNREERELILTKFDNKNKSAFYKFDEPSYLFISEAPRESMSALSDVYHEGFHALVDDFFNDKADLTTLSPIDKDRFFEERKYLKLIFHRAKQEGLCTLFSLKYYEEQLVRKETCLYFIYNLLQTCENMKDLQMLFTVYHDKVLGDYYMYGKCVKQVECNASMTYEGILRLAYNLDSIFHGEHIYDISTTKKLYDKKDEALLRHFEKNFKLFAERQETNDSKLAKMLANTMIENAAEYTRVR